jgi:hypothetical protein
MPPWKILFGASVEQSRILMIWKENPENYAEWTREQVTLYMDLQMRRRRNNNGSAAVDTNTRKRKEDASVKGFAVGTFVSMSIKGVVKIPRAEIANITEDGYVVLWNQRGTETLVRPFAPSALELLEDDIGAPK